MWPLSALLIISNSMGDLSLYEPTPLTFSRNVIIYYYFLMILSPSFNNDKSFYSRHGNNQKAKSDFIGLHHTSYTTIA